MPDRDGQALERLVALIESILIPETLTIESREKDCDDGNPIAEFDIVVAGKLVPNR
jgi:hypothetical protein